MWLVERLVGGRGVLGVVGRFLGYLLLYCGSCVLLNVVIIGIFIIRILKFEFIFVYICIRIVLCFWFFFIDNFFYNICNLIC